MRQISFDITHENNEPLFESIVAYLKPFQVTVIQYTDMPEQGIAEVIIRGSTEEIMKFVNMHWDAAYTLDEKGFNKYVSDFS